MPTKKTGIPFLVSFITFPLLLLLLYNSLRDLDSTGGYRVFQQLFVDLLHSDRHGESVGFVLIRYRLLYGPLG